MPTARNLRRLLLREIGAAIAIALVPSGGEQVVIVLVVVTVGDTTAKDYFLFEVSSEIKGGCV
jgi:hypothetical protein